MAKQRFSLNETMEDAIQNINDARSVNIPDSKKPVLNPVETQNRGIHAEEIAVASNGVKAEEVTETVVLKEIKPEKETKQKDAHEDDLRTTESKNNDAAAANKLLRLRKKVIKPTSENIIRNVSLTEDMLDKLESMKKYLNKTRDKKSNDVFISIADLLNIATQEFLEKYCK